MSANALEIAAATQALSNAFQNRRVDPSIVPSAPPVDDDTDSTHSSSHYSDDLHEWELGKDEILKRAEAGNLSCKFLAGMGYADGHFGFPYSRKEANKWLADAKIFRSGGSLNDAAIRTTAQGFCYQYGFGGVSIQDKSLEKAMDQYRGSISKYIPAKFLYAVARYEIKELDNPQYAQYRENSIKITVAEVKECVDAKFVPAYSFYADRCFDRWKGFAGGYGEANYPEGVRLFHEAVEQGDFSARIDLAQLYYEGSYGVEKDPAKAERILQVAIDNKIPGAQGFSNAYAPKPAKNDVVAIAPPPVVFSPPSAVQTQNQQKKKKNGGCLIM